MKRLLLVIFLIFFASGLAWGVRGPADVSAGWHNLSSSGDPFYKTNEDELCVFCHTPHGGSLDGPLWNRNNPVPLGGWNHYNSASMSTAIKGLLTSRPPSPESLLCLSCHDGSIAVNHVINEPNDRNGAPILGPGGDTSVEIVGMFGDPGSRIGGSREDPFGTGLLNDDHPISFGYNDVLASSEYQAGNPKAGTLKPVADAENPVIGGVRFFGATKRVECSSCHDPHVDYSAAGNPAYAPFLITPNTGSALCLACHNK